MRPGTGGVAVAAAVVLLTILGVLLGGCGGGGTPTATIAGYIVDQPGGSAVENSKVVLQGPGISTMTTTTGSDGRFQFSNLPVPTGEGLPPKFYFLSVSKSQWATVHTAVAIQRAETVHVTLVQLPLDPAFAYDSRLPSVSQQPLGLNRWNVSASDADSGLSFVGWLLDYDWGHVTGRLLNGDASFSDTFQLPAGIAPGEHHLMFVAIDRAGNTTTSNVWFGKQTDLAPLDTPPEIVGAVALTITNSFLDLPPAQPSTAARASIAGLSRPRTGDLLSEVYRATQRAGRRAGKGGAAEGRRVQPAALPPGSDAALFAAIGWRQASLNGVKGFRVYRDGRLALDYPGTDLPAGMEFYQTEDYAAELTPGQTATYKVTAFGTDKESAPSASRSVVPLPVLSRPAPLTPENSAVLNNLPVLRWSPVAGESVLYGVEIQAPGMSSTIFREASDTTLDLSRVNPPAGYSQWPAGAYYWRPLAFRTTPNLGLQRPSIFDYQAISIAAGNWRAFTLSSPQ